ncbi:hypothetical protein SEA_MISHA28_81 [Mycobacterium phage Misha28]|nr:hypothetical protein SEA_MISHA28_81 [Mycobacterium phage Misha28]AVP42468.1 hypothetical protein SEA_TOOTSIEPOP_81 [Mycobacterium phage TootsiePop]QKO03264.1 hypothetical protein SEA_AWESOMESAUCE_81 [Mycobacterium phage Awesomesauce]
MSDAQNLIADVLRAHQQADEYGYPVEECRCGATFWCDYAEHVAAEIAAVVQPRIDTIEQLDALPDHSIIRCASGAGWHKQELTCSPGEPWWCAGSEIECPSSAIPLPARVLYTPEVDR